VAPSATAIEKQFAAAATEAPGPMRNSWQLLSGRTKQYRLMKNNF